jgi:hypothetical protein
MMHGGNRPGAGRRQAPVDLVELEKLCSLHCTDEEIAAWFGVSSRTIENRRKQPKFAEVMARGRAKGRISVRRSQLKLLDGGSAAMAIWLGKQLLGQRDVMTAEHGGIGGGPIKVALKPDFSQLTDDELRQLRDIARKTVPGR